MLAPHELAGGVDIGVAQQLYCTLISAPVAAVKSAAAPAGPEWCAVILAAVHTIFSGYHTPRCASEECSCSSIVFMEL